MGSLWLVLAALLLGARTQEDTSTSAPGGANINAYFDQIADKLHGALKEKGFDPLDIPDTKLTIPFPSLLRSHNSLEVGLKNGTLKNLSQLQRYGNATLDSRKGALEISAPLIFKKLEVYYTAVAQLSSIGPAARVMATVEDLQVFLMLDVNIFKKGVNVTDLQLTEARKIHVRVKGLFLLDPIADVISTIFINFFKTVVLKIAEIRVREELEKQISSIDIFGFL